MIDCLVNSDHFYLSHHARECPQSEHPQRNTDQILRAHTHENDLCIWQTWQYIKTKLSCSSARSNQSRAYILPTGILLASKFCGSSQTTLTRQSWESLLLKHSSQGDFLNRPGCSVVSGCTCNFNTLCPARFFQAISYRREQQFDMMLLYIAPHLQNCALTFTCTEQCSTAASTLWV